jgi:hypothetical protein
MYDGNIYNGIFIVDKDNHLFYLFYKVIFFTMAKKSLPLSEISSLWTKKPCFNG